MPRHAESTLAAIKNAVDIVSLVGEYLPLHRAGSRYKALCPFHDDHKPSLEINPDRQSYKCWSCGAGGDVFDFVKEFERVEFSEALRMLADKAGIPLDKPTRADEGGPTKSDLFAVLAWAETAFIEALSRSQEARDYIVRRGLTPQSVTQFGLGYAPEENGWLVSKAGRAGYGPDLLEKAGLIAQRVDPPHGWRERFRGRLIFPIRDPKGRALGFGGRILPGPEAKLAAAGKNVAKYLNSPETSLFQKRRVLYAADQARPAARRDGFVAVVEGYTDVIAAHQVGLSNVVGTLGTALGDDHVAELRRLADRVVLVFDGDEAGQRAADRTLELFLRHELDARVLSLPDKLDPCDFLLEHGADAFNALIARAVDPLEFAIGRAGGKFDLDSAEGARKAAEWVLSICGCIPPDRMGGMNVKVAKALDVLSRRTGVSVDELKRSWSRIQAAPRRPAAEISRDRPHDVPPAMHGEPRDEPAAPAPPIRLDELDRVDREVVQIALDEPGAVPILVTRVAVNSLRDPALRRVLQACYDLHAEGQPATAERAMLRLDAPELRALVVDMTSALRGQPLSKGTPPPPPLHERLVALFVTLAERDRQKYIRDLDHALKETDPNADPETYRALILERQRLIQQRPGTKAKHAS
ncbi:DNA primase [Isosphaeraceae bacterium EP7]